MPYVTLWKLCQTTKRVVADATYKFILSIIDLPLPIHHVFKSVNRLNDRHSRGCL